jgi:hypothetical protein
VTASRFDPEIATIRSAAHLVEYGRLGSDLLVARLALYNALASGNRALAQRWATTTHSALSAIESAVKFGNGMVAVRAAFDALATIQRGIGGAP